MQRLKNPEAVPSPALLFYWDQIESNINAALQIAGSADRLRPHVKTHKCSEIVRLQISKGIRKFKCATVAEAEMVALAGAPDVLLAYPAVGPTIGRMSALAQKYPNTVFSLLVESAEAAWAIADGRGQRPVETSVGGADGSGRSRFRVYLDIDPGFHRTGTPINDHAVDQYLAVAKIKDLSIEGIHVYDGHNTQLSVSERDAAVDAIWESVEWFRSEIRSRGLPEPKVIAGGTPTFRSHSRYPDAELSPGTFVLYDRGYASKYPDLPFQPAAILLARVISRPAPDRFTIDLGYKAISADPAGARGEIIGFPEAKSVVHSEEHWTFRTERAAELSPGDTVYVVPTHVCPSVSLYSEALCVDSKGDVIRKVKIEARDRALTV